MCLNFLIKTVVILQMANLKCVGSYYSQYCGRLLYSENIIPEIGSHFLNVRQYIFGLFFIEWYPLYLAIQINIRLDWRVKETVFPNQIWVAQASPMNRVVVLSAQLVWTAWTVVYEINYKLKMCEQLKKTCS